jgi:hypothetical protein
MRKTITTWLREPLVQFNALGVALFVLYGLLGGGAPDDGADKRIDVTQAEINWLRERWTRQWQRPPTETELRGLVEDYVREEVLYREALTMGLDRDDGVVRRRMVQKLELLTEAVLAPPTEEQLRAYFQENLDRYRIPEVRSFSHVYFNLDQRGEGAVADAESLLDELRNARQPVTRAPERGDRFLMQYDYRLHTQVEVERLFGRRFAASLFEVEPQSWQGPIQSGYGLHLVYVSEVSPEAVPDFEAVRSRVQVDYEANQRYEAKEALYRSLASGYEVVIDQEAVRAASMQPESSGASR